MTVEQTAKVKLHEGSVYALCRGVSDQRFFSAGSDGIVVKWDLQQLSSATAVARVNGQVFALAYNEISNHLLVGTMSGGLHVIDLEARKEIHSIAFHEQSIFDIKVHDGRVYVASKDGSLSVWSSDTYELIRVITVSSESLRVVAFHPERLEAAIGASDNRVYLIDTNELSVKTALEGPDNSVFSVCYLPEKKLLLAGSRDAQLYAYDLETHQLSHQIKAHLFTINHILLAKEGNCFITASRDKTIRIWNADNFELVKSLDKEKYEGHINSVNKLIWLPSAHSLISASDDRCIIIWKIVF